MDRSTARPVEDRLAVPSATARGGLLLRRLLDRVAGLRRGVLRLVLPDGSVRLFVGGEPGPRAELRIHSARLALRTLLGGSVGFAESYLAGEWDSEDLVALLELFERNADVWGGAYYGSGAIALVRRLRHRLRANHRPGARRNIRAHYDLGNAFYAAWLDPTMLYSAALFADGAADLEAAQLSKCRHLARLIELRPGHRLLEIGSGWGTFAILAAREFGAQVTSITISPAQYEHARRKVQELGLADRVEIRLQDYRDVEGRFDRIASIEMFEAVGEAYWPIFFARLRDRLAADGVAGLQIITIADRWFETYRANPDFIQTYVFPGGMLPSPAALRAQYARAGLAPTGSRWFGADYARTLALWRTRFEEAWPELRRQGFDERFRRLWRYYLAYCETGFRSGSIDVHQVRLEHARG
ncbi:MAG: cyclopropane-fatty-acyl-phospholipid synthase family protein [Geminicoccaceae bacterium]|nr:cyclopropane-fatty-acyl-phospholipid synthase family protein [Geminicoccaceae bacterium]